MEGGPAPDAFVCRRCLHGPGAAVCTFTRPPSELPCRLCGGSYAALELRNPLLSPLPQRTRVCPACARDRHCCQICLCDLTAFAPRGILVPGEGELGRAELRADVRRAASRAGERAPRPGEAPGPALPLGRR